MAVVAHLYRTQRGAARHEAQFDATLRDPDKRPFDVVVEDLSTTGFLVPAVTRLSPGQPITLGVAGVGMCHARVVREDARGYGCEFLFPLSGAELADALAASPSEPIALAPRPFAPAAHGAARAEGLSIRARIAVIVAAATAAWALPAGVAAAAWVALR